MADRQKLLDEYTQYYAKQLNLLVGQRAVELETPYRLLQLNSVEHLKKLYKDAINNVDLKTLKSKQYKIRLQEQLVAQLWPDLQLLDFKQQAYFTSVLSGQLQYGYYTSAYTLEKAAMIRTTVPILLKSNVLGIIANPWLPDKANYSDRIRVNTALIAEKTKDVVTDIVTKNLNYNNAANLLKTKIDESYYRSIALVRTEMSRASSYGGTLSAINNADILDGKYWDATLDSRTAPRCAANDREIFDLDYDTPVNPGVAGKRIPNHTNCRCMYVNKLRYLDPIDIRQARKGDSKTKWGESYVTNAKNYDDYAKERGLPSVKEMLESDDPKRYLRPGETIASLNKQVVRKTFNRNTIVVPRAPWDQ